MYLVGGDWNHGILNDFLSIGNVIIPIDEVHHFSEGLKSPTSYDVPIYFALPKKVPQACVGSNCVYAGKVIE